ncbi:MAG: hypothetical protein CBB95_04830 [Alteromonas sp. TMED35]|nr:MAG: hypothetical protein CBB95_04830 [Alteromonas sp. TMED35]
MCQMRSAGVSLRLSVPVDSCLVMRKQCPNCGYPVQTCLCHAVQPVTNYTEVIILQHPKESLHAKNTVRLLSLTLSNITVLTGKLAVDFTELDQYLAVDPKPTAVFYPAEQSTELSPGAENVSTRIKRAIFIDASWKQAYGIWQNNAWLNRYPFYKLPLHHSGQYTIRNSELEYSFSTLEAVAYTLEYVEQLDPAPLLSLLNTFTAQWQRFLPRRD